LNFYDEEIFLFLDKLIVEDNLLEKSNLFVNKSIALFWAFKKLEIKRNSNDQ
jgi:hypothetical protein